MHLISLATTKRKIEAVKVNIVEEIDKVKEAIKALELNYPQFKCELRVETKGVKEEEDEAKNSCWEIPENFFKSPPLSLRVQPPQENIIKQLHDPKAIKSIHVCIQLTVISQNFFPCLQIIF